MRWEEMLLGLFEDLEQQAEGLHLVERDLEVAERSRAEYAHVTLAGRFHASVGQEVRLDLEGTGDVAGRLARIGAGWCLVEAPSVDWVVQLSAVRSARGLSPRAVHETALPAVSRLGIGSVLRGLADTRASVLVHLGDGTRAAGVLGRVGADFVELYDGPEPARLPDAVRLVALAHVAAVRAG